jgi:hypothetical protein
MLRVLREPEAGSTHEPRRAEAPPAPVPAGSWGRQELGFVALTLDQGALSMPTRQPRGRTLTRAQNVAQRRLAPGNRRVTRGRGVHDLCRRRKAGVRERLREGGGAGHNVRVR